MRSIKAVKQMPKKAHKTSRQVALKAAGLAIDKKAFNLILWDVRPWHLLMDYILILSGHSTKHTQTIAQHIRETFKEENIYSLGVEGLSEGKWILMDYNDVIIHVFFGGSYHCKKRELSLLLVSCGCICFVLLIS